MSRILKIIFYWYHFNVILKKEFYKLVYAKNLCLGKHVLWRKGFSIIMDNNSTLKIGNNCFFNNYCSIAVKDKITIGSNTLFGENVKIYDHNHRFNKSKIPIENQGYSIKAINIGKHCWIGSNVVILKGVTIGDNCVIGAGCVISEDIPKNTIVKLSNKSLVKSKVILH